MAFTFLTNTNIILVDTNFNDSNVIIATTTAGYNACTGIITTNNFAVIPDVESTLEDISKNIKQISSNTQPPINYSSQLSSLANLSYLFGMDQSLFGIDSSLNTISVYSETISEYLENIRDTLIEIKTIHNEMKNTHIEIKNIHQEIRDIHDDQRDDIKVLKQRGENSQQGIVTRGISWTLYDKENRALLNMNLDDENGLLRGKYEEALRKDTGA